MVSTKSLLAVGMLLLSGYTSAENMDDNKGQITKALYNHEKGDYEIYRAPAPTPVIKRDPKSDSGYDPRLVSLLSNYRAWDFCKAYINLHPVVTEYVTVTECGYRRRCRSTTVTEVAIVTDVTTTISTAETSTVTIESTSTTTTILTTTVANPTLTSTVGTPLETPVVAARAIRPPSYLNRYRPSQISAACSQLVHTAIRTQHTTKARTIRGTPFTATRTVTSTTFTTTQETTTPVTTVTTVVATSTITEKATTTTIKKICPTPLFPGAFGIGVNAGSGLIDVSSATTDVECCSKCYYDYNSCSGWVFSQPAFCAVVYFAVGSGSSVTCPNGLGDVFYLTGGNPAAEVGGGGPCFGKSV